MPTNEFKNTLILNAKHIYTSVSQFIFRDTGRVVVLLGLPLHYGLCTGTETGDSKTAA